MLNEDNVLGLSDKEQVRLSVEDLIVSVRSSVKKKNDKDDIEKNIIEEAKIIDGVNLEVNPGEILAILGGSGSGKTTLLNTLSQRTTSNKNFSFEGAVHYNDYSSISRIRSSYLLQDDSFLPHLTVYESLKFAADLKLPSTVASPLQKKLLIAEILKQLGLERISSSVIANSLGKISLSGGERRLVSLALQLLNKPGLLFLDEPTTGLDASSSMRLMTVLNDLAKTCRVTMVLTIHQPRYEILEKVDKIAILSKGGHLIYCGPVESSVDYFLQRGYQIPDNVNLADYLIDISMKESHFYDHKSANRLAILIQEWKDHEASFRKESKSITNSTESDAISEAVSAPRVSLIDEIKVLSKRTFIITIRDRFSILMLNIGMIVISFVVGWLFYRPVHDLSGIRTIQSQIYAGMEICGFVPLFYELSRLWRIDGKVFLKERNEGVSTVAGWLISRRIAKFPTEDFPISLIFCVVCYFMFGLRVGASHFLVFFAVILLINLAGVCCAMMCFAIGSDFPTSMLWTNLYYQLQNNGCGFFVNAKTMPVYVRWTKYIAYFWYGFGALTSNQFTDWVGECSEQDCTEYTGNYVLETLGFNRHWIKVPICILLCWTIGFYVAAGLILQFKSSQVSLSKPKNSIRDVKDSVEKRRTEVELDLEHKNLLVDIKLDDISIWVSPVKFDLGLLSQIYRWVRSYFPKKVINEGNQKGKRLLNNINAKFTAGEVNAILGPSGSGKSTLLNFLAGRLPTTSLFTSDGNIILNSTKLSSGESLGKLCSYVVQHDDHLIPTLTVKETLYYQLKIRLPSDILGNSVLLNAKIDDIIQKMGLKDCENVLIGDDTTKGVSGGEKKRVSIGIQLLDDSKILLLDEPTSGLDSFTAAQILKLLKKLAEEDNKTIILTIHQPKLELFEDFGQILLLSRGGNIIYNDDPQKLNSYLTDLGYPCPKLTNLADHVLDLVSQNLGEDLASSSERILFLMDTHLKRFEKSEITTDDNFDRLSKLIVTKNKKNFWRLYDILTRRQFLTMIRDPNVIYCRFIQVLGTAGLQALYFAPLKNTADGISNRLGVIQEVMNAYYIGFLNNISVYPAELSYFHTEYADGVVDVESFFWAYLTIELPFEILGALMFSALVAIATDLSRTPGMFFAMFFVSFLNLNAGESLGIMIVTIFKNLEIAIHVLSNLLTIGIFMAGTMSLQMPPFFEGWNYISPLKYGVGAISNLGFANQEFSCEIGSDCSLSNGEAVLSYYGLEADFKTFMGVLAVVMVVYRLVAYLLLCMKVRLR